jgi:ectoine hydroxylase
MDSSNAINIAIFLDNVDMYNGPTIVIPQTHVNGMIDHEHRLSDSNDKNMGTMLPYSIPKEAILAESSIHGFSAMTGVAGTAVFFHPNIYHCSLLNVSYAPRKILFITFVATNTTFSNRDAYRPLWLVNRNNQLDLPIFERTKL